MVKNLSKNILATLCYYDCLDYPLTAFEVWKNLIFSTNYESRALGTNIRIINEAGDKNYSLGDVILELEKVELKKHIEEYRGFYFLKERKNLVEQRISRDKISIAKIKKLRRVVWFLRFVPFARMIAATGRLAMKNAESESDWDLLVVLKSGKIWIGRTLITLFVHLLGKRRYGKKIKDRVCLNYFITDESLEIATKDMFSAHEYFFMFPLFDAGGFFEKFRLKNRWIKKYKPNYGLEETENMKIVSDGFFASAARKFGEFIFYSRALEEWLGGWQKKKIMRNPKTKKAGSLIQADDSALVFLPEPQGPEIFEKFQEKIKKLS